MHSYYSKSIDISTSIYKQLGMPGYKKRNRLLTSDLTSDEFWVFLTIVKDRLLSR